MYKADAPCVRLSTSQAHRKKRCILPSSLFAPDGAAIEIGGDHHSIETDLVANQGPMMRPVGRTLSIPQNRGQTCPVCLVDGKPHLESVALLTVGDGLDVQTHIAVAQARDADVGRIQRSTGRNPIFVGHVTLIAYTVQTRPERPLCRGQVVELELSGFVEAELQTAEALAENRRAIRVAVAMYQALILEVQVT